MKAEPKRYFYLDEDDDRAHYIVVARSLEHAEETLRATGIEFGEPSEPYDTAKTRGILNWHEMTDVEITSRQRCHTADDRGTIPLSEANLGEWFSSEW